MNIIFEKYQVVIQIIGIIITIIVVLTVPFANHLFLRCVLKNKSKKIIENWKKESGIPSSNIIENWKMNQTSKRINYLRIACQINNPKQHEFDITSESEKEIFDLLKKSKEITLSKSSVNLNNSNKSYFFSFSKKFLEKELEKFSSKKEIRENRLKMKYSKINNISSLQKSLVKCSDIMEKNIISNKLNELNQINELMK